MVFKKKNPLSYIPLVKAMLECMKLVAKVSDFVRASGNAHGRATKESMGKTYVKEG